MSNENIKIVDLLGEINNQVEEAMLLLLPIIFLNIFKEMWALVRPKRQGKQLAKSIVVVLGMDVNYQIEYSYLKLRNTGRITFRMIGLLFNQLCFDTNQIKPFFVLFMNRYRSSFYSA